MSRGGGTTTTSSGGFSVGEAGQLAAGIGGLFSAFSARALKENGLPVNTEAILQGIQHLPIETWSYIGENQRHIGPYAEDVLRQLGVGSDGTKVNLLDLVGILFAAVQALNAKVEELTNDGMNHGTRRTPTN